MNRPQTRYARSGGVNIAYQVIGDGPRDLVDAAIREGCGGDLVAGSGIQFEDRGLHTLKGVHGEWRLFRIASA